MCDFRVVLEEDGQERLVMENITELTVQEDAISISSLFGGPMVLAATRVHRIDFLANTVLLRKMP
jgi:predicted RNA-binding protein